jgi:hypothetical protein
VDIRWPADEKQFEQLDRVGILSACCLDQAGEDRDILCARRAAYAHTDLPEDEQGAEWLRKGLGGCGSAQLRVSHFDILSYLVL